MNTYFKVYANVNPLRKNELVNVFDSRSFMTTDVEYARRKSCEHANNLALSGFNVYVEKVEVSKIDYTKYI